MSAKNMREESALPTGVGPVDEVLGGGFRLGELYLVYGEEKSGKTSLALTVCASSIERGLRPLLVDCSARLHPARVLQVMESRGLDLARLSIGVIQSFQEQEDLVLTLYNSEKRFDVLVFDDFTHLHRVELSGAVRMDFPIYKRVAMQVALLDEIATRDHVLVLITGQVHDVPDREEARAVAHRILGHWAGWIIKLAPSPRGCRQLTVEKPGRAGPAHFVISNRGISAASP